MGASGEEPLGFGRPRGEVGAGWAGLFGTEAIWASGLWEGAPFLLFFFCFCFVFSFFYLFCFKFPFITVL